MYQKQNSCTGSVLTGAALAAAASTLAAGAYWFFFSEDAWEHRMQVKDWAAKKRERLEEGVEDFADEAGGYMGIVDEMIDRYQSRAQRQADVANFIKDIRDSLEQLNRTKNKGK